MGWNDFSLPVVGCTYDNEDGSSRQLEIAACQPGDPVWLVRQPANPHDPLAVAVFTESETCVGYLARDRACWIAPKIDRGYDVRAIVERVKGRHLEGSALGLVIRLSVTVPGEEGDPPWLPVAGGRIRLPA